MRKIWRRVGGDGLVMSGMGGGGGSIRGCGVSATELPAAGRIPGTEGVPVRSAPESASTTPPGSTADGRTYGGAATTTDGVAAHRSGLKRGGGK